MAEYQRKLESAADALARKQLGIEQKKDTQDEQERLPEILKTVKQKYLDVLDEAFAEVCGQIKLRLGIIGELSDDTMLMIANKINEKATSGDLKFVSDLSQDKEIAAVVENAAVAQQQQMETTRAIEGEKIENAKKDFPSPVVAAAMAGAVLTAEVLGKAVKDSIETGVVDMGNGKTLIYTEPEDPKYAFTSKEAEEEDHEISNMISFIEQYREIAKSDPSKIPELMENLKESMNASKYGVGADAILTYFTSYASIDNSEVDFNNSLLQTMVFERTRPDSSFKPDSFTAEMDLKVISDILGMDESNPNRAQYLDYFRTINPRMVELVEKNPNLYGALREKFGVDLSIEMFGDSEKHPESEMIGMFETFIRENPELVKKQEIKKEEPVEEKQDEKTQEQTVVKSEITPEQKAENFKKALMKMAKAKGVSFALKFANNSISKGNQMDRELLTSVVVDTLSNEEFLQDAKKEDIPVIKDLIGGCLDEQNKKSNSQLIEYVQALGGAVKEITERTAEKPKIEEVDIGEAEPTAPKIDFDDGPVR